MNTTRIERRSRSNYKKTKREVSKSSSKMDIREIFLLQCIICGVILLGGLIIKINNVTLANSIESNLKEVMSSNFLILDEYNLPNISNWFLDVIVNTDSTNTGYENSNNNGIRIDEDTLHKINERNEMRNTTYEEKK